MLNKILKVLMYATVFLMPVFFLPLTFEVLEFSKLHLLFVLVWLSVLVWLLKMIVQDKKMSVRYSIIDFAVLAFMATAVISSVFSVDKISSLFGYYGRFSTGLISTLTFGAFYFLVVNNLGNVKHKVKNAKQQLKTQNTGTEKIEEGAVTAQGIIKTLLWSGGVAMFFAYFALFGIWAKLASTNSHLSLMVVKNLALRISPVGGTLEALAMFLTVLIIIATMMILGISAPFSPVSKKKRALRSIFLGAFVFFAFLLLIIADFTPAWIILSLGLLILIVFVLRKRTLKKEVHRLILPIALIIVSGLFLILNFRVMTSAFPNFILNRNQGFLQERIMSQNESWSVAGQSSISGFKQSLIGSGPGTFYYDFSKFRPETLNRGGLWAVAFERSGNVFAETLATMGFLGLLGFLAIPVLLFWKIFVSAGGLRFRSRRDKGEKLDSGVQLLMLVFASVLLIQFFYYQTLTLSFLFWLFLALAISWFDLSGQESYKPIIKKREFKLKDFVEMALVLETVCIVLFLAFVVLCFFGFKFYLADMNYVKALKEPDLDKKAQILQESIRMNPHQARYQMVISKIFIVKAQEKLAGLGEGENQDEIVQSIALARAFAGNANLIAPSQFNSWQNLTDLYQTIAVMSGENEQFINLAIDSLKEASALEPSNPRVYTDIGRLYLATGQKEEAKAEFEKAMAQKEDYGPANINWVLMLEDEGRKEEAIAKLEWFLSRIPNDIEALFHLGRLYYNNDLTDRAISQFTAVLSLAPSYSNARYSLAIAFEKQGKISQALEQLEIVSKVNPANQEIKDRIQRLRIGASEPKEEIELPEEEEEEEGVLEEIE